MPYISGPTMCSASPANGVSRNRAARQGVLQHAQIHARASRAFARNSVMSRDLQAAILGEHDRLGLRHLRADLGHDRFLLV